MNSPNEILARLYSLLGRVVLLPIPLREKGPRLKGWQHITYEQSLEAAYQRRLETCHRDGGNLGVLLGLVSDRLFALDLDDQYWVEQYLQRIPWLADTLCSRASRGCQFWLRLEAGCQYPNGQAVYSLRDDKGKAYGEARFGGCGGAQSVIYGVHPTGVRWEIVKAKPPLVISLADLCELLADWNPESQKPELKFDQLEGDQDEIVFYPYPKAHPAIYHGLVGTIVQAITPISEADPVAMLLQLLAGFGNAVGRSAFFRVGADIHYTNLFACIVGKSAKARKGMSLSASRWLLARIDPAWELANIRSGLSSGEGLIWQIRDPILRTEPIKEKGRYTGEHQEVIQDPGIKDKRLLVGETEFSMALVVMGRVGNTLSSLIRDAFDSRGKLSTMVKNSAAVASNPHISIIGHITREELKTRMSECEVFNGFANRFLWACALRACTIANPIDFTEAGIGQDLAELAERCLWAKKIEEMERDEEANSMWEELYKEIAETERTPMIDAITDRGDVQMLRFIHALRPG